MGRLKVIMYAAGGLAAASATTLPGRAADLAFPSAPLESVGMPITELGSGWYLRGDVGAVDYARPKEDLEFSRSQGYTAPLVGLDLKKGWSFGGGFGYKFNEWLRADLTGDYRVDSRFQGFSSASNFVNEFYLESGKLKSVVGLFNGYVDLGTWWGVTPYVGAGIGVAHKGFHGFYSQTFCFNALCGPIGPQDPVMRANRSTSELAWALMGGVAVELFGGLSLDANYRYLNLGRAESGVDVYGYMTRLEPLQSHEVRLGIRYMID